MRVVTAAAALVAVCGVSVGVSAENWPSWRGPNGTGVSSEARLPERWGEAQNIAWRARLGA